MHLKERYLYCRSLEFGNCVDFILWHCLFRSPQVLVLRVTLLSHLTSFLKTFLRFWGLLYEQFEASYSLSFSFNALLLVPCCWESLDFGILFVKLCSNPHIHWNEYHCRFIAGNIRTLTLFLGAIAVVTHLSSPHRRWRDERGLCFWICLWSLGSHLNWEDGSPQLTPTIPGHQCPEPEILYRTGVDTKMWALLRSQGAKPDSVSIKWLILVPHVTSRLSQITWYWHHTSYR